MKRVFTKNKQKYVKIGSQAVPFDDYDENGLPLIKPKVTKTKDKNGKEHVKLTIPSLKIKYKKNG